MGEEISQMVTEEDFAIIDHCLMIRMPQEIDHHSAYHIREKADSYLMLRGVDNIVFDFERTIFMDSSGIGVIMGRYKKIACFGGHVYAIHTDDRIRKIIRISGLHRLMEVIS